ncbi:MAG TPA: amidohydrolase family protein [Hyphomicrobiaceae bacterium]|nr:amidohydrolase family protein [Hyphomicrobiaceae bacterium]
MTRSPVIDVHAHILAEETMALMREEAPSLGPRFERIDDDFAVLDVAGSTYRPFPRGAWDLQKRFQDMDAAGIDMQVVSNTPQTFLYNQDAALTAVLAALQNDQIAKVVAAHPDRLLGIATLPMQAPQLAADELRRAVRKLGLKGAQIGSNVNGRNLDDPALEPLWAAANELGAFIMVHPTQVAGAERLKSYYLVNLIGNPLDTTIAAAALVFGGVIERYANIKFLMVHGGGFVPYQIGRFQHGWQVRPEPQAKLQAPPDASLARLLFDTILHGQPALEFLVGSCGASRVLLGSDYPFDMGTLECVRQVRGLAVPEADKATILGGAAMEVLRVPVKS